MKKNEIMEKKEYAKLEEKKNMTRRINKANKSEDGKENRIRKNNLQDIKKEDMLIKSLDKKKKSNTNKFEFKKNNLKIIPLGGLDEIGKNITVFEYENEIILVDCGLEFPEDDMLGIDLVIPDITYLEKNKDKIKGLVITHGHEDHIGAIPYIFKKINIPIYATRLTAGLIKNKLEEHNLLSSTKLNIVEQGQTIILETLK